MSTRNIFEPFKLKSLSLKNRFVMAPMTRGFAPNGILPEASQDYYAKRASAEVGLIISEGTVIEREASSNTDSVPHFYGDEALSSWKKVIDKVHENQGAMAPQIWHMGITSDNQDKQYEGPSGLNGAGVKVGKEMSLSDIEKTIEAFADSALNAKKLGFDCVEIHGAHGYLIDQFFWEVTNKRKDIYGGTTLKERSRFAIEIVKEIRKRVGEDFAILLRLSQWKQNFYDSKLASNPSELEDWVGPLADAGVDIFHCSQRKFWEPEFEDSHLNFAGWVKKVTGKATITVGSVGLDDVFTNAFKGQSSGHASLDELEKRFDNNEFDLVAVGRALLTDPEWVKKVKEKKYSELKGFSAESLKTLV